MKKRSPFCSEIVVTFEAGDSEWKNERGDGGAWDALMNFRLEWSSRTNEEQFRAVGKQGGNGGMSRKKPRECPQPLRPIRVFLVSS